MLCTRPTEDAEMRRVRGGRSVVRRLGLLTVLATAAFLLVVGPASAAEPHPPVTSFGTFSEPNGIAIAESTGTVYVADIGTQAVSKFDAAGNPVNFSALASNQLTGAATPAGSFEFPAVADNPAAIAVDNSCAQQQPPLSGPACEAFDPSFGDLYVLDIGHGVIDKFAPSGAYLSQLAGPFSGQLLGLGVDDAGNLQVEIQGVQLHTVATEVFDNSVANSFVETLVTGEENGVLHSEPEHGFAVASPPGYDFSLFACGCIAKLGPAGEELGRIDAASPAVAAAVDPATGHLYLDAQSSIAEWDTGQMNSEGEKPSGNLLSSFGSAQLSESSGRGGIAVDGASGRIYVSNPADGRVYVFATTVPAATTGTPTDLTQTEATLHATVDPRGAELTSCQFEYGTGPSNDLTIPLAHLQQSVPCEQTPAQIGAGTEPVPVSAHLTGLEPGSLYRFRLAAANPNGVAPSSGLFPTAAPAFGIRNFEVAFLNQDGTPDTQAGSHPYKMVTNIEFNRQVIRRSAHDLHYIAMPAGNLKDISVDLPPGFYGDPGATAKKCTLEQLSSGGLEDQCPAEAEVGNLTAEVNTGFGQNAFLQPSLAGGRLLSIVPPHGVAFQLAAHILIPNAFIDVGLPAGRDSRLSAVSLGVPATAPVFKSLITVYGIPPNGATKPLITLPTACSGPLTSRISADSYQHPGQFATATSVTRNAAGAPSGMTGCAQLIFPPTISGSPDVSDASSPTGFTAAVHISQKAALNPDGLAESNLRDATVTLPEGVTINPGGADGLQGCTEAQAGYTGLTEFNPLLEPGDQTATFTPEMPEPLQPGVNFCPNGSKIGTAQIQTPLLSNPLEGSVYLAAPYQNPFGSLVALYLIAEDPVSGTIVKQVGQVSLDPSSGQLTTTFKNTPDIPFEDLTLHFFGGNRAPLVTPALCGTYTSQAHFTPWSGNGPVDTTASFQVDHGQNGGPCPSGGAPPFHPVLNAGTRSNAAGSYSPLDLELTRGDSEQEFTHFSLKLPPGLSGKLAGIPYCSDAAIAAAKARTGAHGGSEEEEHPSCPAASEVGHTLVGAGVGSVLVWVPGKLYLAGPYHGAPLSVVSITAAKAGAFDFGTVVVRQALRINPETAEVFVDSQGSDPLPHIIQGVPTHLRNIEIYLDRPNFTLNPTSCEHLSIASTVLGSGADFTTEADDRPITVSTPFQAADCASLGFKPKLKLSLKGGTKRGATPAFKAVLTARPGDANIGEAQVTLPHSEFLEQAHIGTVCTRVQFKEGTVPGEKCPAASIYGRARAVTPILDEPLEGPVYLRSSSHNLPDLVAALNNKQVNIDLDGHIDSVKGGRIRNSFEAVPDAPVTKFTLEMQGGKKGLLTNSTNLCKSTNRAISHFVGQNGKVYDTNPILQAQCSKGKKGKSHRVGTSHR